MVTRARTDYGDFATPVSLATFQCRTIIKGFGNALCRTLGTRFSERTRCRRTSRKPLSPRTWLMAEAYSTGRTCGRARTAFSRRRALTGSLDSLTTVTKPSPHESYPDRARSVSPRPWGWSWETPVLLFVQAPSVGHASNNLRLRCFPVILALK